MTGRARRDAPQGPAPLTAAERAEAERALVSAFRAQIGEVKEQIRVLDRKRADLERARAGFELSRRLDDMVGLNLYTFLTEGEHLDRGGDVEVRQAEQRAEQLVGRYLQETGNPYLKEYGK